MILNMKITKNQFFGFILMLSAIMMSPFYLYPSGSAQPSHFLMLITSIAIIFINRKKSIFLLKSNKAFVVFLCWVFSINLIYYLEYKKYIFIINSIYWFYGFLIFLSVLCVFNDKWLAGWIKKLIWIQLVIILISYLIGLGTFTYWPRYEFFFNSPNQLAYYTLAILIIYTSINQGTINAAFLVIYSLAVFAILITGSRSAFLGFIPMILILLYITKGSYKKQFLLILLPIVVYQINHIFGLLWCVPNPNQDLIFSNDYVYEVGKNTISRIAELCVNCKTNDFHSIESQLRYRGYLRILDFPQYLLFGAGQGLDERFFPPNEISYEIHSSLFGVLFYYGLIGLILFLAALYKLFKSKINILLLSPLFLYGLFTYGLRSPYFWLVLSFTAFIPNIFDRDANSTEPVSTL